MKGIDYNLSLSMCKVIKNINGNKLFRKIGLGTSHGSKILLVLESEKIIIREREGRRVYIKLTDKGNRIKELLFELDQVCLL